MLLLGLDTETTGLDPKTDRIIEIGAVVWDTDNQTPVLIDSFYLNPYGNEPDLPWSQESEAINGISRATLETYGFAPSEALDRVMDHLGYCDYIVAHNGAAFDKLFFDNECARYDLPMYYRPWIDTQNDIEYPESITTRKLMHLAAEHGFLNPFSHRAVFDVLTMLKVLSCYDIEQVIAYSKIPTIKVRSLQKFEDNEQAKARSFRWDGDRKIWWRTLKEDKLEALQSEAPFKIIVLKEEG